MFLSSILLLTQILTISINKNKIYLQEQLQSVTEQLSDEQQPASHEQSGHPEFPQLQPITNTTANIAISFFIILLSFWPCHL